MLMRILALLLAVSVSATGCFTGRSEAKPLPPPSPLRMELEDYAVFTATTIERVADDILERNESPAINRNTLFWRIRVIPLVRRTLTLADDEAVLLGLWLLGRRMSQFVEEGDGRAFFGNAQHMAIEACHDIEQRIERIASKALSSAAFASAEEKITAFAEEHPVSNRLDVGPDTSESWGAVLSSTLGKPLDVLGQPLSRVSPRSGLDDATVAAHRVAASVEQVVTQVQYLPDNARWQADLMVLELEESRTVKTALEALENVGEGTAGIAATAAKLPASFREEASKLVDDIDQKQAGVQATLDKARAAAAEIHATATEARVTVEGMDKTLDKLETVVRSTEPSAESLTRMGEALAVAFDKFTVLIEVLKAPSTDPAPPVAEEAPPFDVNDYGRNAEKIAGMMKEVSAVLDRVEKLTQPDAFAELVGSADGAAQSTLDYFFVGAGLLILFGFLVALGYRYLTRRM